MMKKLLALLLSMMMAASLAAPAFAAPAPAGDEDPNGELLISPGPGVWGEDWDFNWTADKEWEYICGENPERVSIFLEEVEAWYAGHAGEYDWCDAETLEGFIENSGGEAGAYLSLYYEWNLQYEEELAHNELLTSLGGVPGQVGVMVNGRYIQFPDAVPEIRNDRTMVPVRALAEALGGEADYVDGKVICQTDAIRLTFIPGEAEVLVEYLGGELPGDGQMFPLDCAPYIKDDRTYVPVRFIGEALGCEVGWDSGFQTAILVDREALAAEIDKDFTILNRAQAAAAVPVEEGQGSSAEMEGCLTFTAFDTLNGNKTYTADLTAEALLNTEAASGICSITMSGNAVDALAELVGHATIEYDMDYAALARAALTNLKDMEVIINREGLVLARIPALDELGGVEGAWYGVDMGAELAQAVFAGSGKTTMGTAVAAVMGADSIVPWAGLDAELQRMTELYGDDKFTTAGGVSTLTIDADTLDPDGALGLKDACKEFRLTMVVDSKGGFTSSCRVETEAQPGIPAIRLTMDSTQSGGKAELTMNLHISNVGEVELAFTSTRQATGEAPKTEPPEGAVVIDVPGLLNP